MKSTELTLDVLPQETVRLEETDFSFVLGRHEEEAVFRSSDRYRSKLFITDKRVVFKFYSELHD